MIRTITLESLAATGVDITPYEAVAVVQQLLRSLDRTDEAPPVPPFGPPTSRHVVISADGRVECRACAVTPSTCEVGALLAALLGPSGRVPGALRYAIRRGDGGAAGGNAARGGAAIARGTVAAGGT